MGLEGRAGEGGSSSAAARHSAGSTTDGGRAAAPPVPHSPTLPGKHGRHLCVDGVAGVGKGAYSSIQIADYQAGGLPCGLSVASCGARRAAAAAAVVSIGRSGIYAVMPATQMPCRWGCRMEDSGHCPSDGWVVKCVLAAPQPPAKRPAPLHLQSCISRAAAAPARPPTRPPAPLRLGTPAARPWCAGRAPE